ncbi:MAG: polyketide synthase dehydratase domain-containing protein [Verrucomicrobiota bacterium]
MPSVGTHFNYFISASSRAALLDKLRELQKQVESPGASETWIKGNEIGLTREAGSFRAAIIYTGTSDFTEALVSGIERMQKSERSHLQTRQGFYFHKVDEVAVGGQLAFVYPGFGSEYAGMGASYNGLEPIVEEWFQHIDDELKGWFYQSGSGGAAESGKRLGEYGQSGHLLAMGLMDILQHHGLEPDVIAGHSNGENSALYAAGFVTCESREQELQVMAEVNTTANSNAETVGEFIIVGQIGRGALDAVLSEFDGEVVVAMENCANQFVLFATSLVSMDALIARILESRGIAFPFSRNQGFHTRFFKNQESRIDATFERLAIGVGHKPLYSCITGELFPLESVAIVATAKRQWFEEVRFRSMIEQMYEDGVRQFIEVGPNNRLCGFIGDILRGRGCLIVASSVTTRGGCEQIAHLLGQCFVFGLNVQGLGAEENSVKKHEPIPVAQTEAPLPRAKAVVSSVPQVAPTTSPLRAAIMMRHEALMRAYLHTEEQVSSSIFSHLSREPRIPEVIDPQSSGPSSEGGSMAMPCIGHQYELHSGHLLGQRSLCRDTDAYIFDHTFGKSTATGEHGPLPVLPFAISVETAVEAASLIHGERLSRFELVNVRGMEWVILREQQQPLVIEASQVQSNTVNVQLKHVKASGEEPSLFWSGDVIALDESTDAIPCLELNRRALRKPHSSAQDYYRDVLFHGPMFQGIAEVSGFSDDSIEAILQMPDFSRAVNGYTATQFLTSPPLADCVGQLAAFWALEYLDDPELAAFPFKIERVRYYRSIPTAGERIHCVGKVRVIGQSILEADFDYFTEEGQLYAQYRGFSQRFYRNRFIPRMVYQQPSAVHFSDLETHSQEGESTLRSVSDDAIPFLMGSDGFWANVLAYLVLSPSERQEWLDLTRDQVEREPVQWLVRRALVKDIYRYWLKRCHERPCSLLDLSIEECGLDQFNVMQANSDSQSLRVSLVKHAKRLEGWFQAEESAVFID